MKTSFENPLLLTDSYLEVLRCPACQGRLSQTAAEPASTDWRLRCVACAQVFPVINDIPRMLLSPLREALIDGAGANGFDSRQVETARSFGYEWTRFSEMYDEWETNFQEYMGPRREDFFRGKRVLDAGCGTGRHSFYAAKYGASVWGVDLSQAVEVARRNNADNDAVRLVQADLYRLPFAPESFDFIYSLGVLHHMPDPEKAFQVLLTHLKRGGEILIFLYWQPEGQPFKRAALNLVRAARRITTRLPHKGVHVLAFPAAIAAFMFFVWPYRALNRVGLQSLAEKLPMKQYAQYPFRVCVNDQLDRFSAPIETRYTRAEAQAWLNRAGLEQVKVRSNFGWVVSGRKASRVDNQNDRREDSPGGEE